MLDHKTHETTRDGGRPEKRILLSYPHMSGDELAYIKEAFDSNWIAPLGPHVDAFEKETAAFAGVKAALALSSGSAAIHLGLRLLDVKAGDIVFCSTLTFIASVAPAVYQNAIPVFIDSDEETWNMSPAALQKAFDDAVKTGQMPKCVIVAELYGQPPKMDEICAICAKYDVPVLEDAAEALGAAYDGKKCGSFGKIGVYSYNGSEIDLSDFTTALENLTADSFTSAAATGQEEISLTVHLDSERFPTVEIQLYRYDGTNCLAVVDGESVSLVPREQVVDLTEAVRAIVLN